MEGFPARLYDERGQKLSQQNIYLKLSRASYFSFCWPALLLMSVASTDCSVTLQSNWMQVSLLLKINKNIGSMKKYSTWLLHQLWKCQNTSNGMLQTLKTIAKLSGFLAIHIKTSIKNLWTAVICMFLFLNCIFIRIWTHNLTVKWYLVVLAVIFSLFFPCYQAAHESSLNLNI